MFTHYYRAYSSHNRKKKAICRQLFSSPSKTDKFDVKNKPCSSSKQYNTMKRTTITLLITIIITFTIQNLYLYRDLPQRRQPDIK